MRILIVGNGAREEALRRIALSAGHTLPDHGPWDQVVLSLPRSEIGEEAADLLPKGQHVICGMTDEAFDRLAKKRGWRIHRVLEDETYTLENALLTAEGAIHAAIGYSKKALSDSLCMVIGYGRIGQALTRLLRGLHIATIVVARRKESREAAGKNSVSMEELPLVLPEMDVIFNTVPAMILDEEKLALVKKDAVLLELASKPYGINLKAAEEIGLAVHVEGGLPGRYCPELAAKAVLNYMEREAEKMSKTKVGFALTGSFCTFRQVFSVIQELVNLGYEIQPILSYPAAREDTRFFESAEVWQTLERITKNKPFSTLPEVEPIGPKKLLDAYIIAPMTGASMGKMAHGIFDTPALLGAKSHLRNSRPVLVAPSTNDGLSTAAENIGKILAMRNVYIVPFGQDDPTNKPRSVVADFSKIPEALAAALAGAQMQPILLGSLKNEGK